MTSIPDTMRALTLSEYCKPQQYGISTSFSTPKISKPDEVLIKVHAASINPVDVKLASGAMKVIQDTKFPVKVGYDVAGVVVSIGTGVTRYQVGDEVYSRIPSRYQGAVADYVISTEAAVAIKPKNLNWTEAASVPLATLTSFQALKRADGILQGGLRGKTVLIPGGLSGTGLSACQLAKNVFGANVITTLSTGKIQKAKELFGDDFAEIIDYTKQDIKKALGARKVDFLFDTMGQTLSLASIVKKSGVIVTISTVPGGSKINENGMFHANFVMKTLLDLIDWFFGKFTSFYGLHYDYLFMEPSSTE